MMVVSDTQLTTRGEMNCFIGSLEVNSHDIGIGDASSTSCVFFIPRPASCAKSLVYYPLSGFLVQGIVTRYED